MATNLPEPPVPGDLDLRGFPYMPLDVVRLRDSDLVIAECPEAFQAAVLLWCASWHQVPAGSVPNDDRALARLVGYGRDLRAWRKIKEGAMRGFVLCSDDRFYHGTVCEKAIVAHATKVAQRKRTQKASAARWEKPIESTKAPSVTDTVSTRVTDTKGREGKGIEIQNPTTSTSPDAARALSMKEGQAEWIELCKHIVKAFNEHGGNPDFPINTQRVWIWENQGYKPNVILAVIRERLATSPSARATTNLRWFDQPIAEAHTRDAQVAALPRIAGRTEAEEAEAWKRRITNFKADPFSWAAAFGPRPDAAGCRAPAAILLELGFALRSSTAPRPVLVHTSNRRARA